MAFSFFPNLNAMGEPVKKTRPNDLITDEDVDAKKAQLLQGFRNAGVSKMEAEQVIALYLEQRDITSPPPLPPRSPLSILTPTSTNISKSSPKDLAGHQILIISDEDPFRALVFQYYLELLRVEKAVAGNPWLFHRVNRLSSWSKSKELGFNSRGLSKRHAFIGWKNRTNLAHRILKRIYLGDGYKDDPHDFYYERYDFFLTESASLLKALERDFQQLQSHDPAGKLYRSKEKMPPRACLIHFSEYSMGSISSITKSIHSAADDFLSQELGWQPSQQTQINKQLQVEFQQILVTSSNHQFIRECDENTGTFFRYHHCDIRLAQQSEAYGMVASIVGEAKNIERVKKRIPKIMDDKDAIRGFLSYASPAWKSGPTGYGGIVCE